MKKVLITRMQVQYAECAALLAEKNILSHPLPMIKCVGNESVVFQYSSYDVCILTSPMAVSCYLPYACNIVADIYVAIGEITAKAILKHINNANIKIAEPHYLAEVIKILDNMELAGKRVVSPGARERIADLAPYFAARGAEYESPITYETVSEQYKDGEIEAVIADNQVNMLSFCSPSAVHSFFKQCCMRELPVFVIGTSTAAAVREYGIEPIIAAKQTFASMANAIFEY